MKNQVTEKWEDILNFMRDEYELTSVSYRTWIQPLKVSNVTDDTVIVSIDNKLGAPGIEHIEKKYSTFLRTSIAEIVGKEYEVSFVLQGDNSEEANESAEAKAAYSSLNPRYTFDSFVIGSNNKVAHAAAAAVAEDPGGSYNPLFIYGGVGLGKTHLAQAIAHEILIHHKDKKVIYTSGEIFTNELIQSIRDKTGEAFRTKYRNADVLIIDDIQFISGKITVQEEFFWTFNALYENKKQIVLASDRPPKEMSILEDRLSSRFKMGFSVDISHPDYETRLAIISKKAQENAVNIDNSMLEYIAENITTNVRELEAALGKVISRSRLTRVEITMDLVKEVVQSLSDGDTRRALTLPYIVSIVAEHYTIPSTMIFSKNKEANIAYPRHIAIYLCKKYLSMSYVEIGKAFNRDHSTVMASFRKVEKDIKEDPNTASTIDLLVKKINPNP